MSRFHDSSAVSGLSRLDEATGAPVRTLDRLIDHAHCTDGVREHEIREGDWVVVRTKNSTYSLAAIGDGRFLVSGGWFRAGGAEQLPVRIVGCTWGGSAIHTRMVAAAGMCLEFDNGVRTTRIREVRLIRGGDARPH
jgi:hypothetical protein